MRNDDGTTLRGIAAALNHREYRTRRGHALAVEVSGANPQPGARPLSFVRGGTKSRFAHLPRFLSDVGRAWYKPCTFLHFIRLDLRKALTGCRRRGDALGGLRARRVRIPPLRRVRRTPPDAPERVCGRQAPILATVSAREMLALLRANAGRSVT